MWAQLAPVKQRCFLDLLGEFGLQIENPGAGLTGRPSLSPRSREAGDELSRGAVVSRKGPRRRLSVRQGQLADRVNPRTPRPVGDDVAMWCRDMQDERVIWTTRLDDANLDDANDRFSSGQASDEASHSPLYRDYSSSHLNSQMHQITLLEVSDQVSAVGRRLRGGNFAEQLGGACGRPPHLGSSHLVHDQRYL